MFWGFSLDHFKKTDRLLSTWFLISSPNNYIINTLCNEFLKKAKKNPVNHPYLLLHYTFNELVKKGFIYTMFL
jgi:CRISPR/Cas system endoribonuclease Cas6 (RAMP superfamily)